MTGLGCRITVVLLCLAASAVADERRYAFEQFRLDNGLTVISLEDFSCPIVAVQVWYHVGSKDEDPERQGFAHMFEHMMFRGTDRLGPTDHFDNVRRVGGRTNAYTSFDQTVYIAEVPANQLELVLWLEAERMAFLEIDQDGFHTERKVVEEERRLGLNAPYGTVPEKLVAELFKVHPYRWMTIGKIPHLRKATIDELQAFWDKYYVPNNATLVVVGAVKHADVRRLATEYFGWIPSCPAPPRVTIKEPEQTESRTIRLKEDKGPVPIVGVVYRTVPVAHPDQLALQVGLGVLGGGESSRLYVDVVKKQKIAQMALGGSFAFEQDGLAGAGGILLPLVGDPKKLVQAIKRHVKRLRDEPITEAELAKMKTQLRRNEVAGAVTIASKARLLGQYAVMYGDAERINRRLAEIDAVTADAVQRVARRYLTKSRRNSILVEPSIGGFLKSLIKRGGSDAEPAAGGGAEKADKENRIAKRSGPKAGAVRPKGFPDQPPIADLLDAFPDAPYTERSLSNGLRVVVVPNHEVPMVSFKLGLKSGAWTEDRPGVANLAMSMLTKGTKTRDALKMAETLESQAISLAGSTGLDTASVAGSALTEKLDLAIELLADVVRNPTFGADEFEILRKQLVMGLMISSRTPQYVADREFRRRLWGDHPYARTVSGESADVKAVEVHDLEAWWSQHGRPENAVLYLAGDITPTAAVALAEKHLGTWTVDRPFEQRPRPVTPAKQETHIYLVDRPRSVQSQIRVGHLGITRGHSDFVTSRVLSNILGGGFNSRLNKAIRVDKGLTYGARGRLSPRRFAGEFKISTFTKTRTTAETLRVILEEIDKIRSGPPTDKELADTKTYITGAFPGQRETPIAIVNELWMIETNDLPADYLRRLLEGIKSTTADRVRKAAESLIDSTMLTIVVVGPAHQIRADLEAIAPVTVIGRTAAPAAPAAAEEPISE